MAKISKTIFLLSTLFFCGNFLINSNFIFADDLPDHIVISEIQIGSESAYDEFVELYNPTDSAIDLKNWDLKRKTKSGTEYNILNNIEGIIPARGYFLIIPRANCGENEDEVCYRDETEGDDEYTTDSFLAKNNTVLLYDNDGNLTDKVGWGEASDFESEIISVNPEDGESLERKGANDTVQDTDNNNDDFILSTNPNPQNSFVFVDNNDNDGQDGSNQETGANDEGNNSDENNDSDSSGENNNDDNDDNDNRDDLQGNSEQENEINTSAYKIIITEFLPNPEDSDRDNEFIEIYNAGKADANLKGWILEDRMGRIKSFEISERTEIKAGGYKVFYSDETKIALNNSGDGVVLKNGRDDIISKTPISNSAKKDQAYALDESGNWVWTLRPTAGRKNIIKEEKKASDIKQNDSSQETGANDEEGNNSGEEQNDSTVLRDYGTNDEKENNNDIDNNNNDAETIEYDFSDEIVISEIYPNPKGRDNRNGDYEWIELYNCSSRDVNLIGWQIDDILRKGSKLYTIKENKIISAESHLVFTNKETKIILNNSGDEINLLWPDKTVVDNTQYGKSIEGQSYNWTSGGWIWSQTITPNKNNAVAVASVTGKILSAENAVNLYDENETEIDESDIDTEKNLAGDVKYIKMTIVEAKKLARFSDVKVSGIVSTSPGIFSDNIFYIMGSGIQVYGKNIDISKINIGDEVEISGRISEVGGEKRILLDRMENIKVISRDNLVESKVISTVDVGEAVEGSLVAVEGEVVEIEDDVFFLNDGSGKVKIYIKPQTGIKKPKIETGDWMTVTGQISRTSVGYRILPRFQADLKLGRVSGISASSAALIEQKCDSIKGEKNKNETFILKNANSIIYAIIVLAGALILFDWGRMRIVKNRKIAKL